MPDLSHTIRKFNRFELKYLISIQAADKFKQALGAYLVPDEHGDGAGSYRLSSLYYDGPDYRFFWEKMDGIRLRRKLRIRCYEPPDLLSMDTPVFVEIKQRLDRVTQKRRVLLPYRDALRLCSQREIPDHDPHYSAVVDEIASICWQYDLRPASLVSYSRLALVGTDYDIGLRVTFDTGLRYRASQLELDENREGLLLFPPDRTVVEIKANERIPYWLTELVAAHNLNLVRLSKYCRSIELAQNLRLTAGWLAVI